MGDLKDGCRAQPSNAILASQRFAYPYVPKSLKLVTKLSLLPEIVYRRARGHCYNQHIPSNAVSHAHGQRSSSTSLRISTSPVSDPLTPPDDSLESSAKFI